MFYLTISSTGRVCVPIDTRAVDRFDPFAVPTVKQICEEYGSQEVKNEGESSRSLGEE